MLGLWIIEDEESRKIIIAVKKYGVDDIPLILQDGQLNADGVQLFRQNQPHFLGNRLFVNGQQAPYLTVPQLGAVAYFECVFIAKLSFTF